MGVQLDHYLDVVYIMSTNTFETLYKIQQSISERWVHWSRSRAEERRYYGLFMQQATNDLSRRRTWRR